MSKCKANNVTSSGLIIIYSGFNKRGRQFIDIILFTSALVCAIVITSMQIDRPEDQAMADKPDILRKNGTYNKNYASVKAEDFQHGIFFDSKDLAQVKYEMLRSVAKGENSVLEASSKYGFSRQSYYIIKDGVDREGLSALIPKKTGPKESYKLKKEGQVFIDQYTRNHPDANSNEVNKALKEATGISVHNRTVDRYMAKKHQGSRR